MEPKPDTSAAPGLRVLLVDPSLFTAPYDAALTQGLLAVDVQPLWATRPTRPGDRQEIPLELTDPFFYRRSDAASGLKGPLRSLAKGAEHAWGMLQLVARVMRQRPDVVHVQWLILPVLDIVALWLIRCFCPVVLTVHDTVPYNGERLSLLQNLGFDLPMRLARSVIVHTSEGRARLVERGVAADKVFVVPHGPLDLNVQPSANRPPRDPRWTFVVFGEIKPYKGVDVLIEAVAKLEPAVRQQCRVIVAGRPRMDMEALLERIRFHQLEGVFDIRAERQTEQQMADLFADADCFVCAYRQIDASGVYFLVKSQRKWLIASRVGVFAEDMQVPREGDWVVPGDAASLAASLHKAIVQRCRPEVGETTDSWREIGRLTRAIYERSLR